MDRDVGVAVSGKALRMLDPHAAEPQFLALGEAVDVIARTDANRRQGRSEIAGEGQLVQGLVSFDQRDVQAGCLRDLGIVAGDRVAVPITMRGEHCRIAKSLRGLDPTQVLAAGRAAHQAALGVGEAVDHRQHRNGAGERSQGGNKPLDDRLWEVRSGSIVDQDQFGRVDRQCLQPEADRLLPGRTASDKADRQAMQRRGSDLVCAFWNCHHDRRDPRQHHGFDRMAHHRLTAPLRELLGQRLSGAQPLSGGDDQSGSGGKGALGHKPIAPVIACRKKGNPLCAACFLGRPAHRDRTSFSAPAQAHHGRPGSGRLSGHSRADDGRH